MAIFGKWFDAATWKKARVRKGPGGAVLLDIVKPTKQAANPRKRKRKPATKRKAAAKRRKPATKRKRK